MVYQSETAVVFSSPSLRPAMDADSLSPVHLVAANLAVVVAVIHLGLGILNWIKWASVGFLVPRDVRWPLFVVSGLVLVAGTWLAIRRRDRRQFYAMGMFLSLGYVVGYFGWHLSGHRPFLLVGPGTHHDLDFAFLVAHLFAGPVEFLAIVAELALAVLLAYLLAVESG